MSLATKIAFVFAILSAHIFLMSTVAEIQAAVERLPVTDRIALFHWLENTDVVQAEETRALLADLDLGLAEADRGELLDGASVVDSLKARARGAA